jgi:acetyl esterase/lipase
MPVSRAGASGEDPPPGGALPKVVRYGRGREQLVEFYPGRVPDSGAAPAVVLFVHGGYWRREYDLDHARPLAVDLAGRGFLVGLVEYRRGAGSWRQTLGDIAAALDTATAAVRDAGVTAPILAMGHSAGGQLVLWAAARASLPAGAPGAGAHSIPDGVIALAPLADLRRAHALHCGDGAVAAFLAFPREDAFPVADPMLLDAPGVPITIVHGLADDTVPIELSRRYAADGRATLIELPGVEHYGLITPGSSAWPTVLDALAHPGAAHSSTV